MCVVCDGHKRRRAIDCHLMMLPLWNVDVCFSRQCAELRSYFNAESECLIFVHFMFRKTVGNAPFGGCDVATILFTKPLVSKRPALWLLFCSLCF